MRETKFRGKKIDGDWYYGDLITETREFNRTCDKAYILPYWETLNGPIFVDKESVGQYTGLKDENGREIYDGDIIKVWITKIINFVAMVDCLNGAFGIGSIPSGYGYHHKFSSFHNNVGTSYEVIGNIYENPELLEGE